MSFTHLDVAGAISMHPLSPLLLSGWLIWVVISISPSKTRLIVIEKIELLERKIGLGYLFFALFISFGLARLLFAV